MIESSFEFPCGLRVPNRIAKASMTERLADVDCRPNRRLTKLYETFAAGGSGLLLTGNVLIDSRCMEAPGNVVIETTRISLVWPNGPTQANLLEWPSSCN